MKRQRTILKIIGRFVLVLVAIPVILGILGAVYQATAEASDRSKYPAPGQMVDIGGYRLHIYCTGEGSPTVILDALFPGTVSNWAWVQPQIAQTTRVCSYDRAGLGWSDSGPEPRDARQHALELHLLLEKAGVPGPYVLVGHSLGGISVEMFANLYPDEVAGMVLVEGTNPDSWNVRGLPEGIGADRNMLAAAPFVSRLGLVRLGLIPSFESDADLPERQRMETEAFYHSTKSWETIRMVDASFSAALEEVRQVDGFGSKPLAIVLGTKGDGGVEALRALFLQQAGLSENSQTFIIEGGTHAGLVDKQEYALQTSKAIQAVVEAVRTAQPLRRSDGP